jgi:hypothetical protein
MCLNNGRVKNQDTTISHIIRKSKVVIMQQLIYFGNTRGEEEQEERRWWFGEGVPGTYEFSTASGYHHNTYHGPARHLRTPLSLDARPLRFTDSPQHYALTGPPALPPTGASLSGTPAPSPRRKSSSTSNDGSDVSPNQQIKSKF